MTYGDMRITKSVVILGGTLLKISASQKLRYEFRDFATFPQIIPERNKKQDIVKRKSATTTIDILLDLNKILHTLQGWHDIYRRYISVIYIGYISDIFEFEDIGYFRYFQN